jgi:hypothetical protein
MVSTRLVVQSNGGQTSTAAAAAFVSGLWAIRLRHQQQQRLQEPLLSSLGSRQYGYVTNNSSGCKICCCSRLWALGDMATSSPNSSGYKSRCCYTL